MKTAYDIILKPVITEASIADIQDKKYTFRVASDANKTEIAKAVEEIFESLQLVVPKHPEWSTPSA